MLTKNDLHIYQGAGADHIMQYDGAGLLMDMGLGKTITTLTAIVRLMFEELEISRVLVIAPKRVASSVWAQECRNWEHTKHLKVSVVAGTERQRLEALKQKADIFTLGRDNVPWLCGLYGGGSLPFDMLVIDELSSFKNPRSLRFRALRRVVPSFKKVVGLTGTPAPNSLLDLWAQIYLLDRGERLGKHLTTYRDNYFKPDKRNGAIVYNYALRQQELKEEIFEKISDICISMKAADYLELPEVFNNIIEIPFPPKLQNLYDDFEKEKVLEMFEQQEEGVPVSAMNAAALSTKLLQFANGAIYDDDKNVVEIHDLKIEEAKNIVEDAAGQPVLIAWTYKHDRDRLLKALKKYGPVNLKTDQHIQDWNHGKIKVLLMHPASGGHGLNLQAGGNLILWFGQNWSLELYQQFNARLARQGQRKNVIINRLVVTNTIDQDVVKALDRKEDGQNGLLSAVKFRIDKYLKLNQ